MNRPLDPREAHNAPALRDTNPRLRVTPPSSPVRRMEPTAPVRRAPEPVSRYSQIEGRRMVVGKEITLSGQISKCDHLVVEGDVEGMRYEGQSLEVIDGGHFN